MNFICILIDDLGWTDLGSFGSDYYKTPNIDRLASGGMKFTNAYSSCTVCSPTRASIMTGKYPARLHITDWIAGHRRPYARLRVPEFRQQLPLEEITIAEALKKKDYATAHQASGIWARNRIIRTGRALISILAEPTEDSHPVIFILQHSHYRRW